MTVRIIKNSGNSGELDESLSGRTDLAKYYNGCSELVNGICLAQGGIVKRSGSIFISRTKLFMPWTISTDYPEGIVVSDNGNLYYCDTAHTSCGTTLADDRTAHSDYWTLTSTTENEGKVKLFSFEFSVDDVHILEFGERYIRVYKNKERIFETEKTIEGITLNGTDAVSIEITGHGYLTGDTIKFSDVSGTTQLSNNEYIIIKTDADNFTLYNTDSSDFSAWTGFGTTKKIYEITSPYTLSEAFEIHKEQSADVMYIAHSYHNPYTLTRLADDNWTIASSQITNGPFLSENTDADGKLTFSTNTAPVHGYSEVDVTGTLTASGTVDGVALAPFKQSHVGSIWLLKNTRKDNATDTEDNTTNTAPTNLDNAIRIKGNFSFKTTEFTAGTDSVKLWRKEGNGEWVEYETFLSATSYSSTETYDNVYYAFTTSAGATTVNQLTAKDQNNYGVVEVTGYTSSTEVSVKVKTAVFNELDNPVANISAIDDNNPDANHVEITTNPAHGFSVGDTVDIVATGFDATDVVITSVPDATHFIYESTDVGGTTTGTATRTATATANESETSMWAEGAWSAYRGFPRTVAFYEQRLYWASTTYNPQTLWGSVVGEYLSHLTGTVESDAIILPIDSGDISQIQWLKAKKTIIVGTASMEFVASATNPDDPMTAIDKKVTPQSYIGSNNLQPIILSDGLFYFQRQGKKLNVMTYSYETTSYKSEDATILSPHIFEDNLPTTIAVQRTPNSTLWITRDDGTLCSFVYEPGESVFAAWSRHVTGSSLLIPVDKYESVAVTHGTEEDEVWVSVKRIINGDEVRYIELLSSRYVENEDEAIMLDSAVVATSSGAVGDIILASDTVRLGSGLLGSGLLGGVPS